ncbi:MAG: CBS domain-containing protein [Gammaproteobacteria bacterium]|nr:CBS domain-containing protein [Gammaproteobacteria bacterium]
MTNLRYSSMSWMRKLGRALSGEVDDRADLVQLMRHALSRGLIDADALQMLEGVLTVADLHVRDIMVPRAQVIALHRDDSPEKLLAAIVESGHSRFPVIAGDRDDVIGILLAKDVLRLSGRGFNQEFDIRECMRPVIVVPESKRVNVLLKDFRRNRNHMAIVIDEYSGVSGLVTIEDALEQIVGEIDDEFDVEDDQNVRKESERQFVVRGRMPITDFNEYFGTSLSDREFDTVAGVVMKQFGRLPLRGETTVLSDIEFRVLRVDRRQIDAFKVVPPRDVTPIEES